MATQPEIKITATMDHAGREVGLAFILTDDPRRNERLFKALVHSMEHTNRVLSGHDGEDAKRRAERAVFEVAE